MMGRYSGFHASGARCVDTVAGQRRSLTGLPRTPSRVSEHPAAPLRKRARTTTDVHAIQHPAPATRDPARACDVVEDILHPANIRMRASRRMQEDE